MSLSYTCQKLREAVSCLIADGPLLTRLDRGAASLQGLEAHHPDGAFAEPVHREAFQLLMARLTQRDALSASAREQLAREILDLLSVATVESCGRLAGQAP